MAKTIRVRFSGPASSMQTFYMQLVTLTRRERGILSTQANGNTSFAAKLSAQDTADLLPTWIDWKDAIHYSVEE